MQMTLSLPKALTALPQWVVWRLEETADGKPTKIPYTVARPYAKASTINPATWDSYDRAQKAVANEKLGLSGLGFVFANGDGLCGLDLDHCLDDDGFISEFAQAMLDRFDSYAEFSPSGKGIHILIQATPPRGRKTPNIEVYDRGRYFTVSGNRVPGTPRTVNERQAELDELFETVLAEDEETNPGDVDWQRPETTADRDVLKLVGTSSQGGKFRRLYDHGDVMGYGSGSEADLALCAILAFWTDNNAGQIDRLFRESALYRAKWDEKRGANTYGEMTIAKAISGTTDTYKGKGKGAHETRSSGERFGTGSTGTNSGPTPEPEVDPETGEIKEQKLFPGRALLGQAMQDGIPPVEWVVDDFLVRGRMHVIYGEPESGKTIISLSWLVECINDGADVLFIDEESGVAVLTAMLADMRVDPARLDEHVHYFPFPGIDKEDYTALLAYAAELKPALIIFDSLTDMLTAAGLDENSGNDVNSWMSNVAQTLARSDYHPAVVMVDHVPKDTENIKYSVGSRSKKAKADVLWYVNKQSDFDKTKTANIDIHLHKNRPGVLPKRVRLVVGGQDGVLICERFDITKHDAYASNPLDEKVLSLLAAAGDEGLQSGQIQAELERGKSIVAEVMNRLIRAELVARYGSAKATRYVLVNRPAGRSDRPVDDSRSSGESSDSAPLYGDDRTIRSRWTQPVVNDPPLKEGEW